MLRVQDVMTTLVQAVGPDASAETAWREMRAKRLHHLVVMSGSDVVGLFSDRDAGGTSGAGIREGRLVSDL